MCLKELRVHVLRRSVSTNKRSEFMTQKNILKNCQFTSKLQEMMSCAVNSFAKWAILIGCSSNVSKPRILAPSSLRKSHDGSKCFNSHDLRKKRCKLINLWGWKIIPGKTFFNANKIFIQTSFFWCNHCVDKLKNLSLLKCKTRVKIIQENFDEWLCEK